MENDLLDEQGEDTGTLGIETDNRDARLRNIFVPLSGTGGGADIAVLPSPCLDFGLASTLAAPRSRSKLVRSKPISDIWNRLRGWRACSSPS